MSNRNPYCLGCGTHDHAPGKCPLSPVALSQAADSENPDRGRTTGPLPPRVKPTSENATAILEAINDTAADKAERRHGTYTQVLRPKNSAERKAEPIHSAIMSYHPDAMAAHARLCVKGNLKHNGPDVPLSWARGKSDDHMDCAARHMLTPDAIDPETGETELVAAFWRLGCALQLQQERLLKEKGVMPYSGITP